MSQLYASKLARRFGTLFVSAIILITISGCACSSEQTTSLSSSNPVDEASYSRAENVTNEIFSETGAPHPKDYSFKGTVVETVNAASYENAFSEDGLDAELTNRGFGGPAFETYYDMEGNYYLDDGDEAQSGDNVKKHPVYYGFYATESGSTWLLMIVANEIMASPFGGVGDAGPQQMVCEQDYVTVYNSYTNEFIRGIPDGSEMVIVPVNKVDAETLDDLAQTMGDR